jgi:hypothetical protein
MVLALKFSLIFMIQSIFTLICEVYVIPSGKERKERRKGGRKKRRKEGKKERKRKERKEEGKKAGRQKSREELLNE